jgi:hypothetical protein
MMGDWAGEQGSVMGCLNKPSLVQSICPLSMHIEEGRGLRMLVVSEVQNYKSGYVSKSDHGLWKGGGLMLGWERIC